MHPRPDRGADCRARRAACPTASAIHQRKAGAVGPDGGRIAPIRQSHFDDLVIKRAVDPRVESVADHSADVEARVGAVGVAADGERMVRTRHDKIRSAEHTSELQSLMRISYNLFSLNKQYNNTDQQT